MARPIAPEAFFNRIAEAAGLSPSDLESVSVNWEAGRGAKVVFVVYPNEQMTEVLQERVPAGRDARQGGQ